MIYKLRLLLLSSLLMMIFLQNSKSTLAKDMNDNSRSNKWKFNLWQPNEASNDGNNSTDVESKRVELQYKAPVNIDNDVELLEPIDNHNLQIELEERFRRPSLIHQNVAKNDKTTFDDIEVEMVRLNIADRGNLLHREFAYFLLATGLMIVFLLILTYIYKASIKSCHERGLNEMRDLLVTNNNRDYWSQNI